MEQKSHGFLKNTSMQNADIWIEFMDTIESVHINTTIENVSNTYLENSILNWTEK